MLKYSSDLDDDGKPIGVLILPEDEERAFRAIAKQEARKVAEKCIAEELEASGFPETRRKRQDLIGWVTRTKDNYKFITTTLMTLGVAGVAGLVIQLIRGGH